ncbi:nitrate- and nitrite sensing domain-containing protein [Nocardia sp. NPDC050710]|uniref:sensor histidine kinase n=1 Tax=Nocardia sp. NPDC050710 TaxID=3157220 RepID=UPI00340504D6
MSLTLVLALLGVTIAREVQTYRHSGDTVDAVTLTLAVQDVLHEVQRERGLSNGWLGGDGRLRNSVVDQRGNTDRALRALEQALAGEAPGATQVRAAVGRFTTLAATRDQIDARRIARPAAFQFYTDGIDALNHLRLGLDQANDPEVRHGLQALYALGEAKEQTAKERGFLNGVFAADEFGPGEYVQFLDIRAAKTAGLAAFARDATPNQQALLDAALRSENAMRAAESENVAITSTVGPLVRSVDPVTWWSQMTAVIDEERAVQQAVGDAVRDRAAQLRWDATLTLGGFLLAALLAIAAEVALVVASLRAIVRPLATLAAEADEVASHRLPEVIAAWHTAGDTQPDPPAPVRTPAGASAEIAAVAGALDRVQATAFELASEQAVMRRNSTESMSNLARRNQNLVRRQLGLISEFEREELDPKALSNLFELDHLATRMRRNAESLLVLVGEASPRRWAEPIPLTDVIRAGLSEVDDYRRVVLRRIDEVSITGAVVSELAHMLAELIENGLAFSPPDLEVEIYGRKLPGGYLLAVVDHGVGMPAGQLSEANARLRGERDFLVAPTRYLGHYVVGRLAQRLDVDVELNTSPVSGIVARLVLPLELLGGERGKQNSGKGSAAESANTSAQGNEVSLFGFTEPDGGIVSGAAEVGPNGPSDEPSFDGVSGRNRPAHSAPDGEGFGLPVDVARNGWAGPGPAHAAGSPGRAEKLGETGGYGRTDERASGDPVRNGRTGQIGRAPGESLPRGRGDEIRHTSKDPGRNGRDGAMMGPGGSANRIDGPNSAAAPTGSFAFPAADAADPTPSMWWRVPEYESPAAESTTPAAVQRTRNGLVKRNKRGRSADSAAGARPMPPRPPNTPVPERSPEEVRGMLSAFRTGHQRGGPTNGQSPAMPPPAPALPQPPRSASAQPPVPAPALPPMTALPSRTSLSLEAAPRAHALPPAPASPTRQAVAGSTESGTRATDLAQNPLDH